MDSSPQTSQSESKSRAPMGKRWTFAILILAFLFVLMPFLFWNATWFGRPLTNEQIASALADRSHPREIQHALTQIESRIEAGALSAHQWYPQIVQLASDPMAEIRVTDAWVMGQDNKAPEFHSALLKMLADPNPMVERNAALSLVRFGDDSGHAQIIAMLRVYTMPSPFVGKLETRLKPGEVVNPGTLVAHVQSNGESKELRAEVPGTLDRWLAADGAAVNVGQPILALNPGDSMVWEALRALYLVGKTEDLPDVERYARGGAGLSQQIMQQAQSTEQAIRSRSGS